MTYRDVLEVIYKIRGRSVSGYRTPTHFANSTYYSPIALQVHQLRENYEIFLIYSYPQGFTHVNIPNIVLVSLNKLA